MTVRTAATRCSGPLSQPIFQPVKENVLPAEEMVMVRSAAPGRVATGMWPDAEGEVLVHLIGDDEASCFAGELDDALQDLPGEHRAGGVVRVVQQHHPGAVGEGGLEGCQVRA